MATAIRSSPRLADPGTLLATLHEAGGGLRVRLRLGRPSDALRMRAFLESLSLETRQRRFGHAMPVIPDHVVRHFTFFNPRERLVVVAMGIYEGREEIAGGREEVVGVADVAGLGTGLAELAVVVDDDQQGRGVGKLLTEVIASLAIQQGAAGLKSELLERNAPMLALLERLGPTVSTVEDGVSVAYTTLAAMRRRAA